MFGGVKERSRLDLNIQEGECDEDNRGPRLGCSSILEERKGEGTEDSQK